jgi:hypothetical protein
MAEKSPPTRNKGFSKFHLMAIVLAAIVIVLIIGMLALQDGEDELEPAVCGEDCHNENYEGYEGPQDNSFMTAHKENNVECWDCHLGEEVKDKQDEPHGEITLDNCLSGCHLKVDWQMDAPGNEIVFHPYTENATNLDGLKQLDSCILCHDPRANSMGLSAETCFLCHDINQNDLESHGEDTCSLATCHSDSPEMRINKTGHLEVQGHCSLCHNDEHPDNAFVPYVKVFENETFNIESPFCISCHKETADGLNITGGYHEVDMCTECHSQHGDSEDCTTCHTEALVPHPVENKYGECQDCHIKGGHNPGMLEFPASKSEILSESFCGSSSCHRDDVYDEIEYGLGGRVHGENDFDEDCVQCHISHSEDVDCYSCHVEGIDPDHSILKPFDDCSRCHVDGHDNYNITFTSFNTTEMNGTFCEACHEGEPQEILTEGPEHASLVCQNCHENARGKAISCDSCHISEGMADPPDHPVVSPFSDCSKCHDTGHDPKMISEFGVSFSNNDFCASCHSDEPLNQYTIFSDFGEGHKTEVVTCTPSCHTDHTARKTCEGDSCHKGASYPPRHASYVTTECLNCHSSAHDPTNSAPRPGSSLSQKEYLENYFIFNKIRLKNTFYWVGRGNHEIGEPCDLCHDYAESVKYSNSSLALLNATGSDCAGSCHNWIDPITTKDPFDQINSSTTKHNSEIFNNASRGGCGGFCHQGDPSSPDLNGSQHVVISNCLDAGCHESQFAGGNLSQGHRDHEQGLEDAQIDCFTVCHSDIDGDHSDCIGCHSHYAQYGSVPYSEKLVAGGCYGCHKSGHDPGLLPENPCKDCH